MMQITIKTCNRNDMVDITQDIVKKIHAAGLKDGFCFIFVPHTTAAVTINENADPSVKTDLEMILNKIIPWEDGYRHLEGNAAAHMKSVLVGASEIIAVENGQPVLGTWQSVFFCEFDGPRTRKVILKFMPSVSC
ncbi:MAG: secondary thiamine-phosphate synthase enzyme YjbQ [Proteobacteria bacterium]|nr:secondary thiamine-phosphate synthase enzyme YjbQ [Pseudomonadota bacterium]